MAGSKQGRNSQYDWNRLSGSVVGTKWDFVLLLLDVKSAIVTNKFNPMASPRPSSCSFIS